MQPDKACIDFIKAREGLQLKAYKDSAGIWTIGYGTIHYEDGTDVKQGDTISQQRADELLAWQVGIKAKKVSIFTQSVTLNQNQYNALVSFGYNAGTGALQSSTLLKKVLANPHDAAIRDEFMKWNKAHVDGKLVTVPGLTNRRKAEADLYFS